MRDFDIANDTQPLGLECPACGQHRVRSNLVQDRFEYGVGQDRVELTAWITVHQCLECDLTFTGEDAEQARHEVVCRHLGLLTPREILAVRESYGLSQSEFAELSKIGKASLARWERGALLQNASNDNLVYLLSFKDNIQRIRSRVSLEQQDGYTYFHPKFRELSESDQSSLKPRASEFRLHTSITVN
ncbi:type II TA system antitoxin MqsA family protein [Paraburkholderia sp. GAS42]|uniref:type II TA system antitoxin MqsA family protein n=1 Tax=Paraburkholderia sp. GAS42 TaxID=3035135 RepID=UPI003D22AEED